MAGIPKVIELVVENDLCIGCGLCVYICPANALKMNWNSFGFLIPENVGTCTNNSDCLEVCPFNPYPKEEIKTENELADIFINEYNNIDKRLGKYIGLYAGYSNEFRLTSSSGGIATYILNELLNKKIVDHIFAVNESSSSNYQYEYSVISNKDELLSSSKTKYYPVTLADVFSKINDLNGRVAVVGVACFIKAIRLAQHKESELKDKIPFLLGIICGGIKSRFFTEYLASKLGVASENIRKPHYRIKDINSTAGDYSFGCTDTANNLEYQIKMKIVGDMWGTGLFKANACDFCDDVATELADISLGDAWINPYNKDGSGNSIIITRTEQAEDLINEGLKRKELNIEPISKNEIITSQQGNFYHRQDAIGYRIKSLQKHNNFLPPKRFGKKKVPFEFRIVQNKRMNLRKMSLELWKEARSANEIDIKIKPYLIQLRKSTLFYHRLRSIKNRIKKLLKF